MTGEPDYSGTGSSNKPGKRSRSRKSLQKVGIETSSEELHGGLHGADSGGNGSGHGASEESEHDPWAYQAEPSEAAAAGAVMTSAYTTTRVAKPGAKNFVQVHPDSALRLTVRLFETVDREFYIVDRRMWDGDYADAFLIEESKPYMLVPYTVAGSGGVDIWPIRVADFGEVDNQYWRSARSYLDRLTLGWARVTADKSRGVYTLIVAEGEIAAPKWPEDLTPGELLRRGFEDRIISSRVHPEVKRRRGIGV